MTSKRAYSEYVVALAETLQEKCNPVARMRLDGLEVEIREGASSLWAIIRRKGRGGVAHRIVYLSSQPKISITKSNDDLFELKLTSALGRYEISISRDGTDLAQLRVTVALTPSRATLVPFLPRDIYPLDADDSPFEVSGSVEAAQRGLNSGLLYFHIDQPAFGSVLYFQNLTAMNGYYRATDTKPDGAVGGEWPELGYLPPSPPQSGTPPINPLPAGKRVTISDAILVFRDFVEGEERKSAKLFLQMLGEVYSQLTRPKTEFRDWPKRARKTLTDLESAPAASVKYYGIKFPRPYTHAEYPDSMVQCQLLAAVWDWGRYDGKAHPLEAELKKGASRFYDKRLGALRRYLPNVGKDKNADAVDSWYAYHPLLNLARLSLGGDKKAERLFLQSLPFAIKAARHFEYIWPVQFNIRNFSVIVEARDDRGLGQTDVGGLYAYVMLQAHQLTGDDLYFDEAQAAIDAAQGMRFELQYQANLTAWGAAACIRLWRLTRQEQYLEQSYVYLASFFHNCEIWESEIHFARHYRNFLGVTCLHDAPYMAIYECYDSFIAFERYLEDAGPDLEPAARMLIAEYCKYALDRAWFYYPDTLPPETLANDIRNGEIDRNLSFPLEDLYPDGQPAGQVGQEIYGAGAAMAFASRSFHAVDGAPFQFFCDHFVRAHERVDKTKVSIQLDGGENCKAHIAILRLPRRSLPALEIRDKSGRQLKPNYASKDRIEYRVPAQGRCLLSWH